MGVPCTKLVAIITGLIILISCYGGVVNNTKSSNEVLVPEHITSTPQLKDEVQLEEETASRDGSEDYVLEVFNNTGSHTWKVPAGVGEVEVLVVAGGGGGGGGSSGGGAGGLIYEENYPVVPRAEIDIEVGAGGSGGINNNPGTNGSDSVFGILTSIGGGGGGGWNEDGKDGGSGGGGGGRDGNVGGSGEPGQGNDGGSANTASAGDGAGGGGGGASTSGEDAATDAGNGGDGIEFSQFSDYGENGWFAGGGGGGSQQNPNPGIGGTGGGGDGAQHGSDGQDASANTGGGGGGGGSSYSDSGNGGDGGSGIVLIRYKFVVQTNPTTDVTPTSANLQGNLTTGESSNVSFSYRKLGGAWTDTDNWTVTESGEFNKTVTDLDPLTKYEFKAVADINGTVYEGDVLVFVTGDVSRITQLGEEWGNYKGAVGVETDGDDLVLTEGELEGYRVSQPLPLEYIAADSVIIWNSTEPIDTFVKIYTAVSDSDTIVPTEWTEATNGASISDIVQDEDMASKYLWVRQNLTTTDLGVTPHLHDLSEAMTGKGLILEGWSVVPSEIEPEESVTIEGTVKNIGNVSESDTVKLYIDDVQVDSDSVTDLAAYATTSVNFTYDDTETKKIYSVRVELVDNSRTWNSSFTVFAELETIISGNHSEYSGYGWNITYADITGNGYN
ncbi:MAG: CARDB domain-containing protein, partial [Thermoplasmata archaeon]